MKQGQRLNLKWSLGSLDLIRRLAGRRMTATQISKYLKRINPDLPASPDEIVRLCNEMHVFIRRSQRRVSA